MFSHLKNMKKSKTARVARIAPKVYLTPKAVSSLLRVTTAAAALRSGIVQQCAVTDAYRTLRRVRRITKLQGLTKQILLLINPKSRPAVFIEKLPANESIDMALISSKDRRTARALEAFDESLDDEPEVVSDWIKDSSSELNELFEGLGDHLDEVSKTIDDIQESLNGSSPTPEQLAAATLTAIGSDAAKTRFDILSEAVPGLHIPEVQPDNAESVSDATEALNKLVAVLLPITGISLGDDGISVDADAIEEAYKATDSNLSDLGYTVESITGLLESAEKLIEDLRTMLGRKDEITANLDTLADQATTVDNDVPPATDDAIPAEEDDTDGADTTTEEPAAEPTTDDVDAGTDTQANVISDVASVYLAAMVVAIETAVGAINSVVTVSDAFASACDTAEEPAAATDEGQAGDGSSNVDDEGASGVTA